MKFEQIVEGYRNQIEELKKDFQEQISLIQNQQEEISTLKI